MASLSERLKRERELRGISLRQISEETRIGVRFLEALEEDRLDLIPGEFYRRSYLRAYARYLGLDEDRALNAYDLSKREGPLPGGSEPGSRRFPAIASFPQWLKWVVGATAVAIPLLLLLKAMPASSGAPAAGPPSKEVSSSSTPPPGTVPASSTAEIDPPPLAFPVKVEPPSASQVDAALRLAVSVEELCWLEIEADGEVVVSGLMDQGYQREITAERELRLWLGNAAGVKLVLNGSPTRPLGGPGQVRKDLTITPANYRQFVTSSPSEGPS
jgi:transcriptional regulator with XRE-family HTH domain